MSNYKVDTDSVVAAMRSYYPDSINRIEQNKWYNYILLFGIRVDICDTSKADDVIGCIWLNGLGVWSSLIFAASTDPSPGYVEKPLAQAAKAGGTAWIKEGQYNYFFAEKVKGYPGFKPLQPIPVYRMPAGQGLDVTKATLSNALDTHIHRSWGVVSFKKDSAGCQILKNTSDLDKLAVMAREHIKKYRINSFIYTLFTKSQIELLTNKSVLIFEDPFYNIFENTVKYQLR